MNPYEKLRIISILHHNMLLKVLIIVFSRTGTTSRVANIIKEETGSDIFNITSLVDYSGIGGYWKGCYHQIAGTIPDIKEIPSIDDYDLIYVGGPTWIFKPAGPILKLLEKLDFNHKKVIPFFTCGGNFGHSFEKFAELAKNADIIGQGAFRGAEKLNDEKLKERVTSWMKKLPKIEKEAEKQNEL